MIELLNKHPKSAKKVREYFLERMLEGLKDKDLPDEFKEHVRQQGITNERIAKLIDNQARALFDVFDENELFIQIVITYDKHGKLQDFRHAINNQLYGELQFNNRKEAEKVAVEKAFKLLEDKL